MPAQKTVVPGRRHLGVGLILLGEATTQTGAAIAAGLFSLIGPGGAVGLRLTFAALMLVAFVRPSIRGISARQWGLIVAYGLSMSAMNISYYEAVARIPLGAVVALELLGPLVLSVVWSRRPSSWLWALLALLGVVILDRGGFHGLNQAGVLFALLAGALWACYIVTARRSSTTLHGLDGLALAMVVGAIAAAPYAVVSGGSSLLDPEVLLIGLGVALLSSTLPYAFEAIALRWMPGSAFAVLMSLEPVMAALAGAVILGQPMNLWAAVAIGLVVVASAGALRTSHPAGAD